MLRTMAVVVLLAVDASAQSTAAGAKAMFYQDGEGRRSVGVGLRFWLQNDAGAAFTPHRATAGHYTLHIRANTAGYISIWDMTRGIELMSRAAISGGIGLPANRELVVPDVFEVASDAPEQRIIVVWGPSQTEQAGRASGARQRLTDFAARLGGDGTPQIVHESDDMTEGQVGTYVINREGRALATEIVFRGR